MKDLYIILTTNIKRFLGMCNSKKCYKKAVVDFYIPSIGTKRCLCTEHFIEFQKIDLITYKYKK